MCGSVAMGGVGMRHWASVARPHAPIISTRTRQRSESRTRLRATTAHTKEVGPWQWLPDIWIEVEDSQLWPLRRGDGFAYRG